MAYKTILVTVDGSPAAVSRIDLAIDLGIRHQAHVIGLSLAIAPSMPHFAQHPLLADAIAAQQEQHWLYNFLITCPSLCWRRMISTNVRPIMHRVASPRFWTRRTRQNRMPLIPCLPVGACVMKTSSA